MYLDHIPTSDLRPVPQDTGVSATGSVEEIIPVLLIDDDEDAFVLTRDMFSDFDDARFTLDWVQSYEGGISLMKNGHHAVLLVDYRLGPRTGMEFLTEARAYGCATPIIMITGQSDHGVDIEAIRRGASNYLVKGQITPALLQRTMLHAIEQKHYEEQLLQYIRDLHDSKLQLEANERELRALNEKLTESEAELRVLNTNKDRFFHIVSHDLRSPFSALLSFAEMLANDIDLLSREEVTQFARSIHQSSRQIWELLENLLYWSRLQRDSVEHAPVMFSVGDVVSTIVTLLAGNAGKKSISVVSTVGHDVRAFADRQMVTSIIQNLLSNALKFTPEGGNVRVTAVRRSEDVEITIEDDGVGMTPQELEKLFRTDVIHSTRGTAREQGTGLGLLLCREMAEKNNGGIRIESVKHAGTRVSLTLPSR